MTFNVNEFLDFTSWAVSFSVWLVSSSLAFAMGLRIRAPKLRGRGSGYSSGPRIDGEFLLIYSLYVVNDPKFLWFRINRDPAEILSGRIYDNYYKNYVGDLLRFRDRSTGKLSISCVVRPGDQIEFLPFVKANHSPEYAVASHEEERAAGLGRTRFLDADKSFQVHLEDSLGRKHKLRLRVRNSPSGMDVEYSLSLADRLDKVRSGFVEIIGAFRLR